MSRGFVCEQVVFEPEATQADLVWIFTQDLVLTSTTVPSGSQEGISISTTTTVLKADEPFHIQHESVYTDVFEMLLH